MTPVRPNPLKHALAGDRVALPPTDEAAVRGRMIAWQGGYDLATDEDHWDFEQYVVESVRLDRCRAERRALQARVAARAASPAVWDLDRTADAEEVGLSLARKPGWTVARLKWTRQGCDWLLRRWYALRDALARTGAWTDRQTELAFNLTGANLDARGEHPWPEGRSAADLVRVEAGQLEDLRASLLVEMDESDRGMAAAFGWEAEPGAGSRRLQREEAACQRRLREARARLRPAVTEVEGIAPAAEDDDRDEVVPEVYAPPEPELSEEEQRAASWAQITQLKAALDSYDRNAPPPPPPPRSRPTLAQAVTPAPAAPMNRRQRRAAARLAAKR